ncbi:MAG: xylulose 5-phosphate 3-epimerase [Planctomycetota bacterium]
MRAFDASLTPAAAASEVARRHKQDPAFARWAAGHGVIRHGELTQARMLRLHDELVLRQTQGDGVPLFDLLHALDRLASAGMWLVVHETYARRVYLDGRPLSQDDFKPRPEGHTGGSLNMVPAYAGYLAANAICGITRSWLMGQGHCVAAIDSLNLLVDNMTPAHAARYALDDAALTRYVNDFYAYRLDAIGRQDSPLGSHVNTHTAGSMSEGGYLGFAELQYVHMPLCGERLVVFLSDGAFEEQRGSDWAARWWRGEDCGLVTPIMIQNGRRIDQRTTLSQQGGADWFCEHLRLNGFDPVVIDGRDPAAFAWAIVALELELEERAEAIRSGRARYPVRLPYAIAVAPKGAGFPGEGTNLAHNLPLLQNPSEDAAAAARFNEGAGRLFVPLAELRESLALFQRHAGSQRVRERDHALAHRHIELGVMPAAPYRTELGTTCPMAAVDHMFAAIVEHNPHLRPRVGNPDEMKSNRLLRTLELLKFRVTDPEPSMPEAINGAVITALNEEAVVAAALANKGGINLVHTYEAFGTKMLGAIRQELIFANQGLETGRPPRWLSVPVVLTSHTWENGKNEQSHQDPTLAEALLGETGPGARVLFPADFNSALAAIEGVYRTQGQIWTLVIPKADQMPDHFTAEQARALLSEGGLLLDKQCHLPGWAKLILVAVGGYQLDAVLQAARRLCERDVPVNVVYLLEPARFRVPRTESERATSAREATVHALFPKNAPARLFVTHTRPEAIIGLLGPLHTGTRTRALGYRNRGGTLDTRGLLFVNRCSWAHVLSEAAELLELPREKLLEQDELRALDGAISPQGVLWT